MLFLFVERFIPLNVLVPGIVRAAPLGGPSALEGLESKEHKSSKCIRHLTVCLIVYFILSRSRSLARVWQVEMFCGSGRLFNSYADPLFLARIRQVGA